MDAREELIEKAERILLRAREDNFLTINTVMELVDFIIEDRKRVISPLVTWIKTCNELGLSNYDHKRAIEETLKSAGVAMTTQCPTCGHIDVNVGMFL